MNDVAIDHEVRLRVHDEKFKMMESKLNALIGLVIGSIIVPIVLHALKMV